MWKMHIYRVFNIQDECRETLIPRPDIICTSMEKRKQRRINQTRIKIEIHCFICLTRTDTV